MRHPPSRSTSPLRVSVFYTYIAQQSSVVQLAEADSLLCTGIRCQVECIRFRRQRSHTLLIFPSSSITIVNIYRPPAGSIASFIEELADLIASIIANTNENCYCAAISTARGWTTHTSMTTCNRSCSCLDWIYLSMIRREAEVFLMSLLQMIAVCFLTSASHIIGSSIARYASVVLSSVRLKCRFGR